MARRYTAAICLLAFAPFGLSEASIAGTQENRPWDFEDILTVPEVTDLQLAHDLQQILYVVRVADIIANRNMSELWTVNPADKSRKLLLRANSIERLRKRPGTKEWTALIDLGAGIQLYHLDARGKASPLINNAATILVGEVDQGLADLNYLAPRRLGILSYDWSPDGKWLWYSTLRRAATGPRTVRFDDEVAAVLGKHRLTLSAEIDFHLRSPDGADVIVASRPSTDIMARYYGGRVSWQPGLLSYRFEEVDAKGQSSYRTFNWNLKSNSSEGKGEKSLNPEVVISRGPRGGSLSTTGIGKSRSLVETLNGEIRHDYRKTDFTVGDPRAAGSWLASDGQHAIVGTRYLEKPRYGLALIDQQNVSEIKTDLSLTKCDFNGDLTAGACIGESMSTPPELVLVDPRTGATQKLGSISPRHNKITPLKVTPKLWVNHTGYWSSGFILWPRNYKAGRKYPAIIITHGGDADERFAVPANQWNYPAQVFAERGYVVLLLNDPNFFQDEKMAAATQKWRTGEGDVSPAEMRRLLFLNTMYSMEDAITELAKQGVVDISRVGIAGYSRGSQIVNVAMTQSKMFRAASSGDGAFLEPSTYLQSPRAYDAIFGGSPFGPDLENYQALSPSLRASQMCGAILFQQAIPYDAAIELYSALRTSGAAVQMSHYPGQDPLSDETHIFHVPSNRMLAMRENLAWFDFWLLGKTSVDAPFPARIDHWKNDLEKKANRCHSATGNQAQ